MKADRLREKIVQSTEECGVQLDDMYKDMEQMINSLTPEISRVHPEGSFQRIFWNQQKSALQCSNPRLVRWHPLIIKWCLYLRHRSSGAYETLRNSGVLKLPSQRTLRDHTHYIKSQSGFSSEVDKEWQATRISVNGKGVQCFS